MGRGSRSVVRPGVCDAGSRASRRPKVSSGAVHPRLRGAAARDRPLQQASYVAAGRGSDRKAAADRCPNGRAVVAPRIPSKRRVPLVPGWPSVVVATPVFVSSRVSGRIALLQEGRRPWLALASSIGGVRKYCMGRSLLWLTHPPIGGARAASARDSTREVRVDLLSWSVGCL